MPLTLGLLLAYLLGSIPAAYLAGRWARGIDLREHGSGNLGATNVLRVLGPRIAMAVLLFDAAKGAIPVYFFPQWTNVGTASGVGAPSDMRMLAWQIAFGAAAILGHVRPVFLLWKGGGKGVATAAGVFLGLAPVPMLFALVVFIAVVTVSGFVSLGSLTAALTLPVAIAVQEGASNPVLWASIAIAMFVFWTHRANIGRLRRGEESRVRRRKADG